MSGIPIEAVMVGLIVSAVMTVMGFLWRNLLLKMLGVVAESLVHSLKAAVKQLVETAGAEGVPSLSPHTNEIAAHYEVFEDWSRADPDIQMELKDSNKLYIMTSRGDFLTNEEDGNPYLRYMHDGHRDVLILLPDIYNRCKKQDWIGQRVREVRDAPGSIIRRDEHLVEKVQHVVTMIKDIVLYSGYDRRKRRIAFFDSLHIGKIVLLDRVGYFQPYFFGLKGKDGKVYKYSEQTDMYKLLSRLVKNTDEFATSIDDKREHLCEQCTFKKGGAANA